ncbi:MAG: DUF2971 domain-containing protein [Bacteroidales bacterium]|nr:DUF2971 domain-containing protein [Bacteroidales bacterium]MCM1147569.1 DUF2971 domain-containing protein [Bacteroidales bacterium]MCM1206359.1 DUF2971 domain-containing protein [Bacillota bacterium]MCM1509093.1 DUF2971 domain-containing protein [Clostridium sp.]
MRIAYKFIQNVAVDSDGSKRDVRTICDQQLFAATYRALNDPFECCVRYKDDYAKDKAFETKINSLVYNAGILSLFKALPSENFPSSETMWTYYANSHHGFCIAYDLDVLESSRTDGFDLIDCIDIKYQNNSPEIFSSDTAEIMREKHFGRKSLSWKKENEVRLVFSTAGLKNIPQNGIIAVYFGLNMPLEGRQKIMSRLKHLDIDFFQIETIPNRYKLKATKVDNIADIEILKAERKPMVDNLTILYKSKAKDRQTIEMLVKAIRANLSRPTNICIVDDLKSGILLEKYPPTTEERQYLAEHWVAMSTFDAPQYVMYYPERD